MGLNRGASYYFKRANYWPQNRQDTMDYTGTENLLHRLQLALGATIRDKFGKNEAWKLIQKCLDESNGFQILE
jgi:hypothetical protein